MEIPNASSLKEASKKGYLQKLSSRSFPYIPHPWKRKFCVLVGGQLFYYEKDDSRGSDKGSGVVNLEYYDQVVEASSKECKKATNVFLLTSQDRSFFDPGRHLFSADTQHDMNEWMRHLKKAIEQIRNNNRTNATATTSNSSSSSATTTAALAASALSESPGSLRQLGLSSKSGSSKTAAKEGIKKKGEGGFAGGEGEEDGEEEEGGEGSKVKKRGSKDSRGGVSKSDDKENFEYWTDSKERKHQYSETSLRRRRANPSSQSVDESSTVTSETDHRKKSNATDPSNSASSSLGRSKPGGSKSKSSAASEREGMTFGSLGRQLKNKGKDQVGGATDSENTTGSNMERRKRKADDDADDAVTTAGDNLNFQPTETGQKLESVTKHRVKGPAGRRMPQNRRTQHLMMKHRASSLSALAHNADKASSVDNPTISFVPWLNRSLDLLEEPGCPPTRNSQPTMGFLYSDQEDMEDPEENIFEYKIGYDENLTYEENSSGLFVQDVPPYSGDGSYNMLNLSNASAGGVPPPLPPRMESRMDYTGQPNQQYQQQQLQQMQLQATFHQQQQNQLCSPYSSLQADGCMTATTTPFGTRENYNEAEMKRQNRKSHPLNELMMTRSLNNELFIASYSDDNSCEASNPQLHQTTQRNVAPPASHSMSPGAQLKQPRPKSGASKVNNNQQRIKKPVSQPDVNRFTGAVRNLQKHVVELDQAVSAITKEVEDSKIDLGNFKTGLVSLRKDKDKLNDAVSIVTQEATKMKEQVIAALKETEKLQRTATSALVVAEKAKVDQINLKKEYENMIVDLKVTIENIKKEAVQNLQAYSTPSIRKKFTDLDADEDLELNDELEAELEEEEKEVPRRKKSQKEISTESLTKANEGKHDGKSSGYQSFFSRPSSIISGLTNRASLAKSLSDVQEKDKTKDVTASPKKSKEKASKDKHDSKGDKKTKKEKQKSLDECSSPPTTKGKQKKYSRNTSEDFPMMDDTGSPRATSPIGSNYDIAEDDDGYGTNFDLGKSTSSPTVPHRPKALNLQPQRSNSHRQTSSNASSPDSPTRASSPFDIPRLHVNGRATSPTGFPLHRPGSTPGPLIRQGSMTTVPEDRAIDMRSCDNRPSEPPPPPPTNRAGVFAISRQNSTPNISTQKSSPQAALQRQHSLGVVLEESKSVTRQDSVLSMPDERLIVDRTLPMSPTPSMMSFPGSWSTTSLNRQDSNVANGEELPAPAEIVPKPKKTRPRGALEQVAGGVVAGSSIQIGTVCPLDESGAEPPLATSSLKKRKKVKKDPIHV